MLCEYKIISAVSGGVAISMQVDEGSAENNRYVLYEDDKRPTIGMTVSGAFASSPATAGQASANEIIKSAFRYKAGNNKLAVRGGLISNPAFESVNPLPSGLTTLRFSNSCFGTYGQNYIWLRRFQYWNHGLSDAELERVTG